MAQGDCFPGKNSNEAKTFAIFSVPLAFSAAGAPSSQPRHGIRAGVAVSTLPNIDERTATPTICRPGKGPENTDLLFAVPQPRLSLGLPGQFEAEASWIPPVRVAGVKANVVSLALGRTVAVASGLLALRARVHATLGVIDAPITCNDAALQDPASECFGGSRSNDAFHPNIFGADLTLGWSPERAPFRPYVGFGYNRLQPRFRVNFTNRRGDTDRRRVEVDLNRLVVFGGASWVFSPRFEASGELYAAPSDAFSARVALRAAL
ncbi:MAG: hypothetical protein ACREMO_04580 [Gemmatimonadales bacterium]